MGGGDRAVCEVADEMPCDDPPWALPVVPEGRPQELRERCATGRVASGYREQRARPPPATSFSPPPGGATWTIRAGLEFHSNGVAK